MLYAREAFNYVPLVNYLNGLSPFLIVAGRT
jgi:hypothetical protein